MKIKIDKDITRLLLTTIKDMGNRELIFLVFIPSLIALVSWISFIALSIYHFDFFIKQFPNIWIEYAYKDGIPNLISYWILIIISTITMLMYGVIISGILMAFASCFISPFVVSFVHKKYFQDVILNPESFMQSLRFSLILFVKTLIRFLILSLIFYLFWFIGLGLISIIAHGFLFFRFFSINLNQEIALNIMTKDYYENMLRECKPFLTFLNIIVFAPTYIPILGSFVIVWQMSVLSHFMLRWYRRVKSEEYIDAVMIE